MEHEDRANCKSLVLYPRSVYPTASNASSSIRNELVLYRDIMPPKFDIFASSDIFTLNTKHERWIRENREMILFVILRKTRFIEY